MFAARGRPALPPLVAPAPGRALRSEIVRLVHLLGCVLALLIPAVVQGQWVSFMFNPSGGTYAAGQQLSVTIEMCGQNGAWFDSPGGVYFNGEWAGFGSYSDTHPDCSDYQVHSGTITLQAGLNTLRAEVHGNGYWEWTEYYSAASSPEPAEVDLAPHNGQYRNVGLCAVGCFDVTAAYAMPGYVSMDVERSTGLVYSSATVSGRHTVIADIRNVSQTHPSYFSLRLTKAGTPGFVTLANGTTEMFVTNFGDWQRVAIQFDDAALPTGSHWYTLIVRSHWPGEVQETLAPLRLLVVNERASPYGAGWTVAGVQRLHRQADGTVVITEGGGGAAFFDQGCGSWCAPPSDFTTLTQDLASDIWRYRRRYPDGTVVSFDTAGLMRRVVDRFGQKPALYTYQSLGGRWVLQSVSDAAERVTTFAYHPGGGGHLANSLLSIQDPGGRTAQFLVNTAGDLQAVTDVDGVQGLAGIYTDHRLTDATDRGGGVWTYGYDYARKLASVSTPYVTADDQWQRLVTQFTSPERELVADPGTSVGTSASNLAPWHYRRFSGVLTAPAGEVTKLLLDRFRATIQEIAPDGAINNITRNQHSQVTHVYDNGILTAQYVWVGVQLREIYDPRTAERAYFEYEPTYNLLTRRYGSGPEVVYTYDFGAIKTVSVGGGPATQYASDWSGRIHRITDPSGHITTFQWLASGSWNTDTVTAGSRKTSYAYDGYGRRTSTRLPDGTRDSVSYDLLNRVTRSAGPGRAITNHHGLVALDSLTDPIGQVYRWQYNALGWTTVETDPRMQNQTYAYDRRGNVTHWVNRRNQTTTFAYDSVGRLQTRTLADTRVTTYSYRPVSASWTWTVASNAESLDTLRTYGDTTYEISVRNGTRHVLKTVRSHAAQTLTLTSPSGLHAPMTYTVDGVGGLGSLVVGSAGEYTTRLTYTGDGQVASASIGVHAIQGGEAPAAEVGRAYRPTHAIATHAVGRYGFYHPDLTADQVQDMRGRLIERLNGAGTRRETFQYDSLGQLVDYKRLNVSPACPVAVPTEEFGTPCTSGTQTLQEQRTYAYDPVGNPVGTGVVVEPGNRVRQAEGYLFDYDADGNLTRKYGNDLDQWLWWNSVGELDSVATTRNGFTQRVRFGYDGFGRRVRAAVDGQTTSFLYRGEHIAVDLDFAGNVHRAYSYYPGVDQPHAVTLPDGATYFHIANGQGNVVGMYAGNGETVNLVGYTPHGDVVQDAGIVLDRFRFAGREYDRATGLYYNRARYYDPEVGRFISEDPIGLGGGINTFAYAGNDPVNQRDPTGLGIECTPEYGWVDRSYTDYSRVPVTVVIRKVWELTGWRCRDGGRGMGKEDGWAEGAENDGSGIYGGGKPQWLGPWPAKKRRPVELGPYPSCRDWTWYGNSGQIFISTRPSGYITVGIYMYGDKSAVGAWTGEVTATSLSGGRPRKVRDLTKDYSPHVSIPPNEVVSGELLRVTAIYVNTQRGEVHTSVPNGCIVP